ncbi:CHAT domain-containing protein [Mangrovibacterium diazotrophicum]|uniref:CHAT domain-containing protein n=1 Tax=Mangrovibacterium diazotrophicum TaxID=1261403 RepID=A0A419W2M3_9BACT|nr:CHAT domain-containing tetratricopeptide repeat protein [Mangrovibacterium diazotrophicum]RKD89718.1 CHAT domain-containing protein [Mangrovibacterium diazotrophicum]
MKKINRTRLKSLIMSVFSFIFFLVFLQLHSNAGAQGSKTAVSLEDTIKAKQYNKEGILAGRLGDFELSRDYFEKLKEIREIQYGANSHRLAGTLINIGIQNKNLGDYDKAIDDYLEAEKLYIREYSSEYPRLGFVYGNLSTIYKIKGDYLKSYEYSVNALRLFSKEPDHYYSGMILSQAGIAESLFSLKRYEEAIKLCEEHMGQVTDDVKYYYSSLLARIYSELGEIDLAEQYYHETFALQKKTGGINSYDLGIEYTDYVKFLLSIKKYDDIPRYNDLSEEIIAKYFTKKSIQYASVMLNYADYYSLRYSEASYLSDFNLKKQDDFYKALDFYQKSIIAATGTFENTDPKSNPTVEQSVSELQLLEILKKKAQCFSALGDLKLNMNKKNEAVDYYKSGLDAMELAIELVHQIRTGFVSEDSRLFLSENQQSTFVEAVNLSYKLYKQTGDESYVAKGFELTEKSKSASFLAAVKDSRAKQFGGIPDSLQSREDVLKINISNYKQMLYEESQQESPDSIKLALYSSKVFYYSEKYTQLVQLLEDSFPNYYSFKYANEVANLDEIRNRIKNHDAIVEYLIDEPKEGQYSGGLFRFVITNKEFSFSRTPIDSTFMNRIEFVYQFLTSSNYQYTTKADYQHYAGSAYELYRDLFANLNQDLEGKNLVVIPDDKLSYIPFDALLYEQPDTSVMNFRNLPYLIKKHSISYTYSTTLLFEYFEQKKKADHGLLAFAPSYVNDNRDYTEVAEFRAGLLPLQAVDKEVEYVSEFMSGDIFKDSLAQETRFKQLAKDYDVLHLAMHTIMNDTLPMYSKLAFAKPTADEKEDDGWLNTSEIYNMQLNARMAVLSACNTGSGKMQKGEGVMSLARGFLYAGCPSIIMTLWEVEDESGAEIMRSFYRFLSNGKNKADALRLAKLEHIENADPLKAHPHFWLAYVAVGNTSPLFMGKDLYFIGIVVVIILALVVDQLRRRKKKIRNG